MLSYRKHCTVFCNGQGITSNLCLHNHHCNRETVKSKAPINKLRINCTIMLCVYYFYSDLSYLSHSRLQQITHNKIHTGINPWMSNQPVADASTYKTQTSTTDKPPCEQRNSNLQSQQWLQTIALDHTATGMGCVSISTNGPTLNGTHINPNTCQYW